MDRRGLVEKVVTSWEQHVDREERRRWYENVDQKVEELRKEMPEAKEDDLYWESAARCLEEQGGILEEMDGDGTYWDQVEEWEAKGGG